MPRRIQQVLVPKGIPLAVEKLVFFCEMKKKMSCPAIFLAVKVVILSNIFSDGIFF
jgi:hypothetical protein